MHYYKQVDDQRAPSAGHKWLYPFLLLLGVGLGGLGFWFGDQYWHRFRSSPEGLTDPTVTLRTPTTAQPLDGEEHEAVGLFKKVKPSVVNVDIVLLKRGGWDASTAEPTKTKGGSGFIWDNKGRIVTNYHVIEDLTRSAQLVARVVLADRSVHEAVLIGVAPQYDLAVLQFASHDQPADTKIQPIDLGTSHDLEVGQKAYAIGNPFGLSLTMTKGIISARDRVIESPAGTPIPGAIQIDAAINPGNSGGPLLDKAGRLIGVNTSITSPTPNGGNVGIGFAVPADTVNEVVTQLIQTGRVLQPDLGIKLYDQRKLRQARFDHGVMIQAVNPTGPAAKAGLLGIRPNPRTGRLEAGDLIVAINGETVDTIDDYHQTLWKLKPGDTVPVKFTRGDQEEEVTVTVGGR